MDGRFRIDVVFNIVFVDLFMFNGRVCCGVFWVVVLLIVGKDINVIDYEIFRFVVEFYKEEGIIVIVVGIGLSVDF